MYNYAIIGGGIVGLSAARALGKRFPKAHILLLEKEQEVAAHQTGHNSGVIHSGIYYKPGSLKATLCREGAQELAEFCEAHSVPYEICGKLIVATLQAELPRLEALRERGLQNGLKVTRLTSKEAQEREPHVHCLAALHVPETGIADYRQVCRALAQQIEAQGGVLKRNTRVVGLREMPQSQIIETDTGEYEAGYVINCAGLFSDRVARLAGLNGAQIVPFRGEYYELKADRRNLVRALIYPVPNPDFPFLGVHFTRMTDGNVHAGPNAVLSLKREGYRKTDFSLRDCLETLAYPGFRRLAANNLREGLRELWRSLNKAAFVRSLQQMIPEVCSEDLVPAPAGVRAQAVALDGRLVDDFLILEDPRSLHVCNAPSPAATASLAIGRVIAEQIKAVSTP